ncbi:MAG TPA: hypothetical protein VH210_17240 [Gaiellaceae bacterium]|nr:hypothetical protein [Gaiellaceae bacterium]
MRIVVAGLLVIATATAAQAASKAPQAAFLHGTDLVVADLTTGAQAIVLRHAPRGPVAWSGDGRLLSDGGSIVAGSKVTRFPTSRIAWALEGETAAYQTDDGALHLWTPTGGTRTIVRRSWGLRSFVWGPGGALALGRKAHPGQGVAAQQEVWVWKGGTLRRVVGPLRGDTTPIVEGFAPDGGVLWWDDQFDSGSIASDGLTLSDGMQRIARTLIHQDFVSVCGSHLVVAAGRDRYTTRGKSIVLDGHDISADRTRSWVSPSCNGTMVVAAAGRNWWEPRIGKGELRAIWELVPQRAQLTHPPAGWTDEYPRVLPDGSVLFVRTHQTLGDGTVTEHAGLELYANGTVRPIGSLTTTVSDLSRDWVPNYYGHYGWPQLLAISA